MGKGYIHVYTGNGKGKTTAALGLSLRAICSGKKVFMGQFIKGMEYSELKAGNLLENFTIKQYGRKSFIAGKPTLEDSLKAIEGLEEIEKILKENTYNVVILDELNIALHYNLIPLPRVIEMLKSRNQEIEVIITGRYAKEEIINISDLVTEMKEIKHYYSKGVSARVGIEK